MDSGTVGSNVGLMNSIISDDRALANVRRRGQPWVAAAITP
jgi:hypothetical protein